MSAIVRVTRLKQPFCRRFRPACGHSAVIESGFICPDCTGPTVNDITQHPDCGCADPASGAWVAEKSTPLQAHFQYQNRCFASSIKTRIFRDFPGLGGLKSEAWDFSYFCKPLHFNIKYAFIE
ncbi:hypothetical protein AB6802_25445 [Mesorhizobium sp. RCC_202]|uniref:hypothetical protein n=1 Tax=Mesorhizobium sp. RCC_202 TaxID=3239222 RepID=UPI00352557EF